MAMRRAATTAPAPERLLTVEEFLQMPESNERYELIRGRLVKKAVPQWTHGNLAYLLGRYYTLFDPYDEKGSMRPEIGVKLRKDYSPLPDVGWWKIGRVPKRGDPIAPVPDLAVEIHSPGQTVKDLTDKALDYIAGGARLVWVFYPEKEIVEIFRPGQAEPERLGIEATLSGEDVIPGFSVTMKNLLAEGMPKPESADTNNE
jgi:Uma2 family endonuclease